jgi:Mn-containing catalase
MFYHDGKLQYPVRVTRPNPEFARALQQAIGGIEGEIRVCLQYLFQAWNCRGPKKYRDLLMETGTEEIAHIEMLATAVAMNLEGAATDVQERMAKESPVVNAVMGGMDIRHVLSSGLGAMATDANGVPFNGSWVVGTGNLASDMMANVHAESSGRALACRLYAMTDDPGMKDMLRFLITRDTMHQNQWLAAIEDAGGLTANLPIPNSFPESEHVDNFAYAFVQTGMDGSGSESGTGRWASGMSMDGKGEFHVERARPMGEEPVLGPAKDPAAFAQAQQMMADGTSGASSMRGEGGDDSFLEKAKDFISGK